MTNFYDLPTLKSKLTSYLHEKNDNNILRNNFSEEFLYNNLFINLNLIKVSFTMDENVLLALDESQLNTFITYLNYKYKISIDSDTLKNFSIKNTPLKNYYIASIEDINESKEDAKKNPASQKRLLKKELLKIEKQRSLEPLYDMDFEYKNKKIISFDFEYKPDVIDKFLFKNTFEVGISIQDGNNINSFHYIVKENSELKNKEKQNLQSSFNFGDSEFVSFADLNLIIQHHISDSDLIVVHEHSNDLRILNTNKIIYDKEKVKDTQYIYSKHFKKNDEDQSKTLKKLLNDHNIIHKNLHNAGNDSRYTLMLFKSMCQDYNSLKRKKSLKL